MDKLKQLRAMLAGEEQTIARGKTSITIDPEHVEAEIRARVLRDVIKIYETPSSKTEEGAQL